MITATTSMVGMMSKRCRLPLPLIILFLTILSISDGAKLAREIAGRQHSKNEAIHVVVNKVG